MHDTIYSPVSRLSPFLPFLLLAGALLLVVCLVVVSIALPPNVRESAFTHLLSFLAVRPYPWGCGGGGMPC
jgi:hypothetical protein